MVLFPLAPTILGVLTNGWCVAHLVTLFRKSTRHCQKGNGYTCYGKWKLFVESATTLRVNVWLSRLVGAIRDLFLSYNMTCERDWFSWTCMLLSLLVNEPAHWPLSFLISECFIESMRFQTWRGDRGMIIPSSTCSRFLSSLSRMFFSFFPPYRGDLLSQSENDSDVPLYFFS